MGARGPRPLPANVHLLRGNPSRLPLNELFQESGSVPAGIPQIPRHIQGEARKEWHRIAGLLEQYGLITKIDGAALANYCGAWARVALLERAISAHIAKALANAKPDENRDIVAADALIVRTPQGYPMQRVEYQILVREREALAKFLADFGLSPSARSRVTPADTGQGELFPSPAPDTGTDTVPAAGWSSI